MVAIPPSRPCRGRAAAQFGARRQQSQKQLSLGLQGHPVRSLDCSRLSFRSADAPRSETADTTSPREQARAAQPRPHAECQATRSFRSNLPNPSAMSRTKKALRPCQTHRWTLYCVHERLRSTRNLQTKLTKRDHPFPDLCCISPQANLGHDLAGGTHRAGSVAVSRNPSCRRIPRTTA